MTKSKNQSAAAATVSLCSKKSNTSDVSPRAPNIEWLKNLNWTWTLITYLTDHPDFRIKIFSPVDAPKERCAKQGVKDTKTQQYAVLAENIFLKEPTQGDGFKSNPRRYAISVETRLRRLKKEYAEHLETLHAAGADVNSDKMIPDTPLAHLVAGITEKWPWWAELHAIWRGLPNYNPFASDAERGGRHELREDGTEVIEDAASGGIVEPELDEEELEELWDADELRASIQSKKPSARSKAFVGATSGSIVNTQLVSNVTSRGKSAAMIKNTVGEFHEFHSLGAVERKRRMDHQLSMAHAANKRFKYEFKEKTLAADHEFRLRKIEADNRLEELRLRLEFEHLRASRVQPVLNTASLSVSPTPQINPALQSGLSNAIIAGISEDNSLLPRPSSHSVFTPIAESSDTYDQSLTSFDTPFSGYGHVIYNNNILSPSLG